MVELSQTKGFCKYLSYKDFHNLVVFFTLE